MPDASARSSARDSSAQARGVENGTGSAGTGRISASGMLVMKLRISARTPWRAAQASHSSMSTRRCRMVTRLTSAELIARTSARSCMRLPAATTQVPAGSACSPSRRSSSSE